MKKRSLILLVLVLVLISIAMLYACNTDSQSAPSQDFGTYYLFDGTKLNPDSFIELKSGNVWYDGESEGKFTLKDGKITLFDGDDELMSGTVSDGVLTLNFMGMETVYKKSSTSIGSDKVDSSAMIKSIDGGQVDGLNVSLEIGDTVEDVDLSGMITTSKDCSWQLFLSRSATAADAIATKIIVPKNGANTYYIVVTSADNKINRTYTLNVWKNYYATLSFYANDRLYTTEEVLTHTTYGEGPSCSVDGYKFKGWGCEGYYVVEDKSFSAQLEPLNYSISFDTNGGDDSIKNITATFNEECKLPKPRKTGYTFVGWYFNGNTYVDSINYKFAQNIKMTAKWQINTYNVSIAAANVQGGEVNKNESIMEYGSTIELKAKVYPSYIFDGWYCNGTKISNDLDFTTTISEMSVVNIKYVAKWSIDEALSQFEYVADKTTCTITKYKNNNDSTVVIPNSVTSIGRRAFYECKGLTSITIGNSVTSIGDRAFEGCLRLIEVCNKSSLNIVAGSSDYGYVSYYAKNVYKEGDSKLSTDENGYVIYTDGEQKLLVKYAGEDAVLILANEITAIHKNAFFKCSSFTSITIPNSVTSIGEDAFSNCTGLTSITIPDSVTSIGNGAFYGCSNLATVNWNAIKCASVGQRNYPIFTGCSKLATINIGNNVTTIPAYVFKRCTGLTSITIPDSVTSIGNGAFYGCSNLATVNWNATSCSSVGQSNYPIFEGCSKLATINIGNNVTTIPDYAFKDCTAVTSVTIGNSVTSIGGYAFYDCIGLTEVTIGNSVTSIGGYAFAGCVSLIEVYNKSSLNIVEGSEDNGYVGFYAKNIYKEEGGSKLSTDRNGYIIYTDGEEKLLVKYTGNDSAPALPSGITSIYRGAFALQTKLSSITIPNSVTSIGRSAFAGCTGLISVTIPASVTSIGGYAFDGCRLLTRVTIPNSVTSIEVGAFRGCAELTSITIPDSVTSIGDRAFYECKGLTSVTIGNSVTSIGDSAFYNCKGLTSVTIGNSVTSIGRSAFAGCTELKTIEFNGTYEQWISIKKGDYWTYRVPSTYKVVFTNN